MIIVREVEVDNGNFRMVKRKIGKCVRCNKEVLLYGFTNTCECGADYNMSGQLLASRSQWGEETGESDADILNYDYINMPEVDY